VGAWIGDIRTKPVRSAGSGEGLKLAWIDRHLADGQCNALALPLCGPL